MEKIEKDFVFQDEPDLDDVLDGAYFAEEDDVEELGDDENEDEIRDFGYRQISEL